MNGRLIEALADALKNHPEHDCADPEKLVTVTITVPHKLLHKCERFVENVANAQPCVMPDPS
jgi:hypothetical protein